METGTRFFGKMPSMVVVRCQFQVHASDFHFLVRVLDTQIRQADFAIDHRKVQLLREGLLEVECLVFLLCLSMPQPSIELFLQLVIELNPDDPATPGFDSVSHLEVQAIKIGIMAGLLRLHKPRVNSLVFRYETLSPNQAFPLPGEGENLPGFLLQNARFTAFDQPLVEEGTKIVVVL